MNKTFICHRRSLSVKRIYCNEEKGVKTEKQEILKDLMRLKNIGPKMAERLYQIGIRSSEEVKQHEPEELYERLNEHQGFREDRCALYIFRGARDNLPWWICSDKNMKEVSKNEG